MIIRHIYVMAAFIAIMLGFSVHTAEARQDVYAYTYNGNNWYVDQDSVKATADALNFTVYTMAGLRYDVSSQGNYYNANVFYHEQPLATESGQSLYKNPGMLAATRAARQMKSTVQAKPVTPPVVAQYEEEQKKQQRSTVNAGSRTVREPAKKQL